MAKITPAFLYSSDCCSVLAKKTPCTRQKDLEAGKPSMGTLGTWSCTKCGKGCKVTRHKNKENETVIVEAASNGKGRRAA